MQPQHERPTLETPRLTLRPFTRADAPAVQRLVGDRDVASTTLSIPHPYEDGMAEQWIATHQELFDRGTGVIFAISLRSEQALVGAVGLRLEPRHAHAELGTWIGKPYWRHGYATEAAAVVLHYGFEGLGLHRIFARHFTRNPASGRVLQKLGMRHEGCLRQHALKWGVFEDTEFYGILKTDAEMLQQR
jgi:[ribosomal protein S5]-alanine N-acetyltransferase